MKTLLLAGIAALSVLRASAAEPKEPPVIKLPSWFRDGSVTPIRPGPGPGPTLLIAYKKVICKDVSFTMWIIWDYAVGQAVMKNGSPWVVTDVTGDVPTDSKLGVISGDILFNGEKCQSEDVKP